MYGEPALPPDFTALPYANPDAPKGGRIVFGESGGFDSLNPFIVKGRAPAAVSEYTVETLMARSLDEPFTLYGLLAESVETDEARSWVAFTLRPEARFSDGKPVTVEDVIWSLQTLGDPARGLPRYTGSSAKIASIEQTGPRRVKITFNTQDRELPLILGLRPILEKAQWQGKDFFASSLEPPVGSGPYVIREFEAGRHITYARNPDWWGKDLPFNRGLNNFDEIRVEYFADANVVFEAFKAGELSSWRETNPAKWATNFDFPAVQTGEVVKSEIPHRRPSGIEGFVMNTRRPQFADWRVRQALIDSFNFELVNRTLNGGAVPRITSYFGNSTLGADIAAPAPPAERALLAPFADSLLPGALDGYSLPVSDGSESNRKNMRAAMNLLEEAGWTVRDGVLTDAAGAPFVFDILLVNGQADMISAASIWREALKRLGIDARIVTVDNAQYTQRVNAYDFDVTHYIRSLTLSPGNEQVLYWGADGVTVPATRNWMGMAAPAADAMIATMLNARDPAGFATAVRALDRVLTTGRYVVPLWYSPVARIAHDKHYHYPEKLPLYGDWPGFQPQVWWYE
ncbi:MAG: extracellular solute-binding protein [Paracoccaceae bacterium]